MESFLKYCKNCNQKTDKDQTYTQTGKKSIRGGLCYDCSYRSYTSVIESEVKQYWERSVLEIYGLQEAYPQNWPEYLGRMTYYSFKIYENRECLYCTERYVVQLDEKRNLHIPAFECDHMNPESRGGSNHARNAAISCKNCNQRKRAKRYDTWIRGLDKIKHQQALGYYIRKNGYHPKDHREAFSVELPESKTLPLELIESFEGKELLKRDIRVCIDSSDEEKNSEYVADQLRKSEIISQKAKELVKKLKPFPWDEKN